MESLVYRTDDSLRWGGGQGSNLTPHTVDLNFWTVFEAIGALEAAATTSAGIDFISQPSDGNQFYIHLTDHRVLGPFTLPAAQWNPRGKWLPFTNYAPFDVVTDNGSVYLVTVGHLSGATFSPFATDGIGHDLYVLILEQPTNQMPADGLEGQRLVHGPGSPFSVGWAYDKVRMYSFVNGLPDAGELIMQYPVVDFMRIPAGLTGSAIYEGTPALLAVSWELFKNGASIGTIDFSGGSPEEIVSSVPSDIHCVPGDVITLVGPSTPDAHQSNISFTIVALITGLDS